MSKQMVLMGAVVLLGVGCKVAKDKEAECVDPPEAVGAAGASEKKVVMSEDEVNWCRACVVGPHGFMSCQRVNQSNTGETEKALRDRARLAACTDSGFTEANCPADKVISLVCKGDPPPTDKRAAGEALLKALKGSGPLVLTEDGTRLEKVEKKVAEATEEQKAGGAKAEAPSAKDDPADATSNKPVEEITEKP